MDREKLPDRIRSLKESRRYSEAEEEIRHELQKNPTNPSSKPASRIFTPAGRLIEARILIEEVLACDPQHPKPVRTG